MSTVSAPSAAGLYERHHDSVFRYCLSRLARRDEAEEAAQTTFARALQSLQAGVVPASEPAWLLGIARNVCLARHESAARRRRLEEVCDPVELARTAPAAGSGHDELLGLEDALRRLPEQQRLAVLLRDWRGLSYHEIADELGVSHAAVETLIFRGRDALAALLRETPASTRRRLASLGDVASLLATLKQALGGGAAAAKVAAAVVAVTAVSATGIAVDGTRDRRGVPVPAERVERATPERSSVPAAERKVRREANPSPSKPSVATVAPPRGDGITPPPAVEDASAPTPAPRAEPVAPEPLPAPAAAPAPDAPRPAVGPHTPAPPAAVEPPAVVEPVAAPVVENVQTAVGGAVGVVDGAVEAVTGTVDETAAAASATVEDTVAPVAAAVPAVALPPLPSPLPRP